MSQTKVRPVETVRLKGIESPLGVFRFTLTK